MDCPLCFSPLTDKKDESFYDCSVCGGLVKDSRYHLTSEQEKARYKQHNSDVNDTGYREYIFPLTSRILGLYGPEQGGLDFGCGHSPVAARTLEESGYTVTLYDPFFYANPDYRNRQYDYIYSCEVFEHFREPAAEIEQLLEILKPGGRLLIMTQLFNNHTDFTHWHYRRDPTHIFIYTPRTIQYISSHYNLELEYHDHRTIIYKKPVTD